MCIPAHGRPSHGHLHDRRGEVPVVSARTCGQPVSFPAHHTPPGGHTSPWLRSNQCRSGCLPAARWPPGKKVVYIGPMVRWAAGRPQEIRGGISDWAGLFRGQGSLIQNSASVVLWGRDSRTALPSPISKRGPLFRELSLPMSQLADSPQTDDKTTDQES